MNLAPAHPFASRRITSLEVSPGPRSGTPRAEPVDGVPIEPAGRGLCLTALSLCDGFGIRDFWGPIGEDFILHDIARAIRVGLGLWAAAGVLVAGLIAAPPANAQPYAFGFSSYDSNETLTLATTDGSVVLNTDLFQGWISNRGAANIGGPGGNTSYFTGVNGGALFNDFFAFNITGLTPGTVVTGVTLSVSAFTISDDVTYTIGNASALANSGALFDGVSPNMAIYNALGVGGFGSYALTPGQSDSTVSFVLNSAAISAINADIGAGDEYFAVGGTTNSAIPTIPEPSTWAMMLLGFAGLGFVGYRASRRTGMAAA
jgi:hypothetical protein